MAPPEAHRIGSGVLTSVGDVARQIAALVDNGIDPLLGGIVDRRQETVCAADVETTRRLINYVPATCLAEGLRRTVEAYRLENSLARDETQRAGS